MRRCLLSGFFWVAVVGTVVGCGDDGGAGAPDTILEERPADLTRDQHVRITFHAEGPTNGFLCTLDGANPQECESPFETDVQDGAHTFVVAAGFGARVDETPAMHAWTVDSTPPDTTITVSPPALDNATMPVFEFTATDASATLTFECSLDLAAFATCTSPQTVIVSDGDHSFAVRGKDLAGNVDETPATSMWTVSTAAPETTITSGPTANSTSGPAVMWGFSSTLATATFECSTDGATYAACTSPIALSALTDGGHMFAVRAIGNGMTDPSPAMRSWNVDAIAPTVTIDSGPADPSNDSTPTYTFSSADGGVAFECSLDGGAFASCASPFTAATALAEGAHTFAVRATDAVGNVGGPASAGFTLDLSGPTVTITSAPAALSNDTSPTTAFTTGGSPVTTECQVDGGAFAACASPFTTTLADGAHTIVVRVTDAAGNTGMAMTTFTIDATPPTVTITSQPGALSNDATATVTFTTAGTPTTVTCSVDGGAAAACTTMITTGTLADGPHTIVITATDAAGNSGMATAMFTVDATPPVVTITSGPNGLTNDSTPTFGFTATGASTVECRIDTATFAACAGTFTAATLTDGAHTFEVRGTDGAGNTASATRMFTVDTTPPTVTITNEPSSPTTDNTPTIVFTTAGSPTSITCSIDGGAAVACTSPFTSGALTDGPHTITVTVTDAAGNTATDNSTFTVDANPPVVTITSGPNGLTNDNTPTFGFTVTGATVIECRIDGGTFVACSGTFTPAALADGAHTFEVRGTDAALNQANATRTFSVDATPPTVTITTEPLANSNDTTPTVVFTTGGSPTSITCAVDAGTAVSCTSPFTTTVAQGTHTITVTVTDAATNTASDVTASFVVDTTPPTVTITSAPPASWPVNYFDFTFTAPGATTTCSLNGAAFTACTSPLSVTANYGSTNTFSVRGTDPAGNTATATATWTPNPGLVMHYQYEQGATDNSSLLAQVAAYSPNGSPASQPFVGGWGGAALGRGLSAHGYAKTARPLSSGQGDSYTVSFWVRAFGVGNGILFSTRSATGGLEVKLNDGSQITATTVEPGGQAFSGSVGILPNQWVNVSLVTTGVAKNLFIFVNGNQAGVVNAPTANGFGAGQAASMVVGSASTVDFDDLRFYNRAMSGAEICGTLARGAVNGQGICEQLTPYFEYDFEAGSTANTGQDVNTTTSGFVFNLTTMNLGGAGVSQSQESYITNVASLPRTSPRTMTMWFNASTTVFGRLLNQTNQCAAGTCGVLAAYLSAGRVQVTAATTTGSSGSVTFTGLATGRPHSLVLAEQGTGLNTTSLRVYIDGVQQTISFTGGSLYQQAGTDIQTGPVGSISDEIELWKGDLSANPEMLCSNGWDGEWDDITNSCSLANQ